MADANLTGQTIASTYNQLLITADTGGITGSGGSATQIHCGGATAGAGNADTTALYLSTTRVGIGTAAPLTILHINDASSPTMQLTRTAGHTSASLGEIQFGSGSSPTDNSLANIVCNGDGATDSGKLSFGTQTTGAANTTRMTIDSTGKVGIGTTAPAQLLDIASTAATTPEIRIARGTASDTRAIANTNGLGSIAWYAHDSGYTAGQQCAAITCVASADWYDTASTNDAPCYMSFWTQSNGASNGLGAARMVIDSNGFVGIGTTGPDTMLHVVTNEETTQTAKFLNEGQAAPSLKLQNAHSSTATMRGIIEIGAKLSASAGYNFLVTSSNTDSPDIEHQLEGDGTSSQDGGTAWTDTDYAEYFETSDGNAIIPGISVVLVDGKIRAAQSGETPFGVTRPLNASCCIGGSAWNKWSGKYLRTPYGAYDLDSDGLRRLNPDYVENLDEDGKQIYIPRSERDEWQIVGLLGQIPINKGQQISSTWIKMWEATDDVDMYYVFPSAQVIN
jgi:hypothetical protein